MPRLDDNMQNLQTASNYHFSAVTIDELGATEYTLVTIAMDESGSVSKHKDALEETLKTILESCKKSPRAENLLLRLISFDNDLREVHGFKLLNMVNKGDYTNVLNPTGGTALFDAVQSSIEATNDYGRILVDQDYSANAVIFVITDGDDNSSVASKRTVKNTIDSVVASECLEGVTVILVGIGGDDPYLADKLEVFKDESSLHQFVGIDEATPANLAKLAQFISRSISSTSQALSNGTTSEILTF